MNKGSLGIAGVIVVVVMALLLNPQWRVGLAAGLLAAPTPGPGAMTVYAVTNPNPNSITVSHIITDAVSFRFEFTSTVLANSTVEYHVRDMPNVPNPFTGSMSLQSDAQFSADVIYYDYPGSSGATSTPTATQTATPSATANRTSTSTSTPTPTATQDRTSTSTATPTRTSIATQTRTSTSTATKTVTLTSTATPTQTLLYFGQYYDNIALTGTAKLERFDSDINFNWSSGSPDPLIPIDNFSVRWTRSMQFTDGNYRFHTVSDDGIRLWIDGNLLINNWTVHPAREDIANLFLAGGWHDIKVEYFEATGLSVARFWWEQIVSTATPTATQTGTSTPTSVATQTGTSTPTSVAAQTGTSTPTSVAAQTGTSTPTSVAAQTSTSTPTSTAAQTGTSTPTSVAAQTSTSTPTSTAAQTGTSTPMSTAIQTSTSTPTSTAPPVASPTATPTSVTGPNMRYFLYLPSIVTSGNGATNQGTKLQQMRAAPQAVASTPFVYFPNGW